MFLARLTPTEGSERQGTRPVVVVSRDAINQYSPVVIVVPLTDRAHKTKIFPSQMILKAGEGGLRKDSVALTEQVRAISLPWYTLQGGRMKSESKSVTELVRITKLWDAGRISDSEFGKRTAKVMAELKDTKRLKKILRDIDSRHGKKASPVVQGGLPSLGKHQ